MPRKRWIKLWTQETLYGTTSRELTPEQQSCWFKLLALAGDSMEPGKVQVADGIPITDKQIAGIFRVPLQLWKSTKERLLAVDKIFVNTGVVHICNWDKYQSEYDRTKPYKATGKATRESTAEATPKSGVDTLQENLPEKVRTRTEQTRGRTEEQEDTLSNIDGNIFRFFEANIGQLRDRRKHQIGDWIDEYGAEEVMFALERMADKGVQDMKYPEAILENRRAGISPGHDGLRSYHETEKIDDVTTYPPKKDKK